MVYMLLSSSTELIKSPFGRVPARSKIALALAFLKKASFYTLTRWIRATMFFQRPHQCTVREYLYVTMDNLTLVNTDIQLCPWLTTLFLKYFSLKRYYRLLRCD
jgi:hypothetical protein